MPVGRIRNRAWSEILGGRKRKDARPCRGAVKNAVFKPAANGLRSLRLWALRSDSSNLDYSCIGLGFGFFRLPFLAYIVPRQRLAPQLHRHWSSPPS